MTTVLPRRQVHRSDCRFLPAPQVTREHLHARIDEILNLQRLQNKDICKIRAELLMQKKEISALKPKILTMKRKPKALVPTTMKTAFLVCY
ncbi:hypothetical protein M5689_010546 [Euphorbia peplus]|nr:hypothetical protein M5689_010546 [Euphorbia peplus]